MSTEQRATGVDGERLRTLALELAGTRRRVVEAVEAMTRDQRRATGVDDLGGILGREIDRLAVAAEDLDRLARRPALLCASPYGACPDHGATLHTTGPRNGRIHTACKREDCSRTWTYDRIGEGCDQEATLRAVAPDPSTDGERAGEYGEAQVCAGHGAQLVEWGWAVSTLPGSAGSTREADAALAEACRRAARRRSGVAAATALITGLGYTAREVGEASPSYHGVFSPITVRVTGAMGAEVVFEHDHTTDVYVFASAWSHGVIAAAVRFTSWAALVEALALKVGAVLPPVVLAAREADGGVEALAEDLNEAVRPALEMGFAVELSGDPAAEVVVTFTGYGRAYRARYRHAVELGALVFAGAWEGDDLAADCPATWSTWAAFTAALHGVATAAAEAID